MKEQRMFGLWPSPVTSKNLAAGLRLGEPCWDTDGRTLAWVEGRSDRGVIVVQDGDGGATRDLTPGDMSVRAFVGYGGGDFTLSHGVCCFVGQADQRIYRQELAGGAPRPITPAFGAASTPTVSPDGRWLVYIHTADDQDCIAIVDTAGLHWPARLTSGRDFYMQPTWRPDGEALAWVEWDHPNMPWDGTELRVADLVVPEFGLPVIARNVHIAGGPETAIFQPAFSSDGRSILFVSDETGIGQLYRAPLAGGPAELLTDGTGDFATPAWNQGMRRFAAVGDGRLAALRTKGGFDALVAVDSGSPLATLESYGALSGPAARPGTAEVALAGSGAAIPSRIIVTDLATGAVDVRRRSDGELVPAAALARAEHVSWRSFDGEEAHGIYYAPASDRFTAAGAPPLIVSVHGGPTSQVKGGWDATAQFFATRGYAVLLPNYRGSTGYGRAYMLKLRESWGIYDVQDSKYGAQSLADRGLADAGKLVIMGGSAGGYTVLQSLVDIPGFYKAAICMFGVSNQFTLASDTHKFEARYSDSLLGALPEAAARYRDRSPIFHANRIVDPVALFQGDIDRVVPRAQSDAIAASLRARGVPHEYHVYEGEGHGWRKAETIDHFWTAVERFLREYVLFA